MGNLLQTFYKTFIGIKTSDIREEKPLSENWILNVEVS